MKKILWIFLALCYGLTACEQAPKADKATVTDAQTVQAGTGSAFLLDTTLSHVEWVGTKPTGKHHGTLQLSGGAIYVQDSLITGGQFVVNMYSLKNTDLAADTAMKNKLENELKGAMFFDVKKYPAATFEITRVTPLQAIAGEEVAFIGATHTVQGNLTLKAVTKNISFPARIILQDDHINALANFNIDRTLWGISYRADKSLQDKLINSQVNIGFNITAKR
ncbi:YceI family protein [Chitinophaga nivalis]|uniref:YceI family protein n=1 Tax=Chitinophaga nivalis TaxID=2991709 RepID=A0ABT3IWG1_9BACT|nr:YceI family protein [Chitinophaga nivalis]MCW3461996.1 YceI family protein [Chitinophaga nivalis]MCW3488313.1 YceI family protein [Chitinophaga nivalis]